MQLKMYRLLRKETWENNVIKIVFFLIPFLKIKQSKFCILEFF